MALQTIPGFTGYAAARVSSLDKRAVGKLTDTNHLESLHQMEPAHYDKKIISLYTQTSLYSNDFLEMINQSVPFYIESNSDSWQWNIQVPYKFPRITQIPDATAALARPGIDGQEFQLVLDSNEFAINDIITPHKMYCDTPLVVAKDPLPAADGFVYSFTILTETPLTTFIQSNFIQPGVELQQIDSSIGEFDEQLSGLPRLGEKITLYETLGSGYSVEHTVTGWADDRMLRDGDGKPLDITIFAKLRRNEIGQADLQGVRWEPYVETMMRKKMLDLKVTRMVWGKPGTTKTAGSKQELKKVSGGIYYKMRNNGNRVTYNRGQFSLELLRDVFGDLFYRRVDIKDRRVKIYTNEAGFDLFNQANKQDLLNSGLTIIADDRFIEGKGQHMTISYGFDAMVTRETGRIDLVHLRELDLPQTNLEFGQNKKSTPLFMVFDVSTTGDGTLKNNIREVRLKGRPSMTWGYVDGRRSHLGFAKSQGHQAASKFDGYTIFMDDRCDVFIEDLSRTVIIEEVPQF
jgi:hypothetical protein